jgi:hypothetical protein
MACLAELTLARSVYLLLAASSIVFGLGFGSPASAGSAAQGTPTPPPQKGVNIGSGPKAPAADDPIARLQMTADLLAVGRATKDPLALIVAARIMKSLGGTDIDLKPDARAAPANVRKPGQPISPDTILLEARDLAKGDKITNLLIDETAAMGRAGGAGQPKTHQDTVQPAATDVYTVVFNGGELAETGIAGDGASDVDLFVYDENDHLVCRSTASTDREYCRWWPRWTGPLRIEVQNLGIVSDLYRLATN